MMLRKNDGDSSRSAPDAGDSTKMSPNCQNDADTTPPVRCTEINGCQDRKQETLEIHISYWSFRRGESPDTWANEPGPSFTELLIQIFRSSFNKFLFLILI